MGLILLIIATILKVLVAPFAYMYGTVKSLKIGGLKEWNKWNFDLAVAKDQYGNGLLKYVMNDLSICGNGYQFGNIDETISSVLGKNKNQHTLTKFGIFIAAILNKIDPNHVEKSIDYNEGVTKIK